MSNQIPKNWVLRALVHTQLCPTLCDLMDWSPPGSSVHGIFQARILEWVAISFSLRPLNIVLFDTEYIEITQNKNFVVFFLVSSPSFTNSNDKTNDNHHHTTMFGCND